MRITAQHQDGHKVVIEGRRDIWRWLVREGNLWVIIGQGWPDKLSLTKDRRRR